MTTEREIQFDAWLALAGQAPAPAQAVKLPLLSGSMSPAIPVQAILEIDVQHGQPCRAGDVVVFCTEERLVAHRVLLRLGAGAWCWLLEKGDANPLGHWQRSRDVRGRVIGFETPTGETQGDPTDPRLAKIGLRRHIRHWLVTLGGLRPEKPGGPQNG